MKTHKLTPTSAAVLARRDQLRTRAAHVGSALICSCCLSLGADNSFELGGFWDHIRVAEGGVTVTNTRPFSVAAKGEDMIIRVSGGSLDRGIAYSEHGISAGTRYEFVRFQSSGTAANDATVVVTVDPQPQPMTPPSLIWQIYSPHPELSKGSDDYLKPLRLFTLRTPIANPDHASFLWENVVLRTEWTRSEAEPRFLQRLVQFADGRLARRPRSDWELPEELKTNRTNSLLTVVSWTNLSGVSIPSRSIFVQYAPDTNHQDGPLVIQWHEQVTLTNGSLGTARTNFIPQITKRTRVLDYRASADVRQPVEYSSTNAVIIEDPVEAYAEMERQQSERARARAERKAREAKSAKEAADNKEAAPK